MFEVFKLHWAKDVEYGQTLFFDAISFTAVGWNLNYSGLFIKDAQVRRTIFIILLTS